MWDVVKEGREFNNMWDVVKEGGEFNNMWDVVKEGRMGRGMRNDKM
jgi:hypothetical protein